MSLLDTLDFILVTSKLNKSYSWLALLYHWLYRLGISSGAFILRENVIKNGFLTHFKQKDLPLCLQIIYRSGVL